MPRQKIPLSEKDLLQIESMAGYGLKVEQMAAILGMSKKTFERRMKDDPRGNDALLKGRSVAALNIVKTAYDLAKSGKCPAMTMFWLKCRENWKDSDPFGGDDGRKGGYQFTKTRRRG